MHAVTRAPVLLCAFFFLKRYYAAQTDFIVLFKTNLLVRFRPVSCFCLGTLTALCCGGGLISSQEVFVFF